MKSKPLIFLEASFWRRLVDQDSPDRRRATYAFLKKVARRSQLRISRIVTAELAVIRDLELRRRVIRKLDRERVRHITAGIRADRCMEELREAGVLGGGHLADLYHIGYALVGGCDYLVTWDVDDLARPWTQGRVAEFCRRHGFRQLRIGTPIEVAERWLGIRIQ